MDARLLVIISPIVFLAVYLVIGTIPNLMLAVTPYTPYIIGDEPTTIVKGVNDIVYIEGEVVYAVELRNTTVILPPSAEIIDITGDINKTGAGKYFGCGTISYAVKSTVLLADNQYHAITVRYAGVKIYSVDDYNRMHTILSLVFTVIILIGLYVAQYMTTGEED